MSVKITRKEQQDPVTRASGDIHYAELEILHRDGDGRSTRWVSRWRYESDVAALAFMLPTEAPT